MSNTTESLTFKIGLSGTFFKNVPAYNILIDGVSKAEGKASASTEYVEFTVDLAEDQEHLLEIKLTNKTNLDTITEGDIIVKDTLLNIDSIEIDEIELDQLKWSKSEFIGDDPARPVLDNCVNLGWNGSYRIKFTSPFYLWLLESM